MHETAYHARRVVSNALQTRARRARLAVQLEICTILYLRLHETTAFGCNNNL